MTPPPSPPCERVRTAYGLLSTNLLVLPGLGTWVGGRRIAGAIQMVLATVGLGATLWGVGPFFVHAGRLLRRPDELIRMMEQQMPMMGAGVGIFLAAWLWGLVDGMLLVRRAQQERPE